MPARVQPPFALLVRSPRLAPARRRGGHRGVRWRIGAHGHVGRAAADGSDSPDHHAGVHRNDQPRRPRRPRRHVVERSVAVRVRGRPPGELVRDLIGRQHERREHWRWRHRWRRKLDRREPAGRSGRRRHAKRRHLHRHERAAPPARAAAAADSPSRSAHRFFGVVLVVVVVVFGTAFVTSVALYSTRVPG